MIILIILLISALLFNAVMLVQILDILKQSNRELYRIECILYRHDKKYVSKEK